MRALARSLSTFILVQLLLTVMGFLITRSMLNAVAKTGLAELIQIHWLPKVTASYGLVFCLVPAAYVFLILWLNRRDPAEILFTNTIARTGWLLTIALATISALSISLALKALCSPVPPLL